MLLLFFILFIDHGRRVSHFFSRDESLSHSQRVYTQPNQEPNQLEPNKEQGTTEQLVPLASTPTPLYVYDTHTHVLCIWHGCKQLRRRMRYRNAVDNRPKASTNPDQLATDQRCRHADQQAEAMASCGTKRANRLQSNCYGQICGQLPLAARHRKVSNFFVVVQTQGS